MQIEERVYNGDRARDVLENEAFIDAFASVELEVTDKWKNSPARDEAGREKLWLLLWALKQVQSALTTTLETGKLARMELNQRQSLRDRAKDWLTQS